MLYVSENLKNASLELVNNTHFSLFLDAEPQFVLSFVMSIVNLKRLYLKAAESLQSIKVNPVKTN